MKNELQEKNSKEESIKIILIGEVYTGKTSLINVYIKKEFDKKVESTISPSYFNKTIRFEDKTYIIYLWDTAGQEQFRSITRAYFKNAVCALVVYDITNKSSFENIKQWIEDCMNYMPKRGFIVLVGNKCDLEESRQVTKEEGMKYKNDQGLDLFMETSAKTGYNARNVLIEAAKILYADYLKYIENNPEGDNIPGHVKKNNLKNVDNNNTKKKKCC